MFSYVLIFGLLTPLPSIAISSGLSCLSSFVPKFPIEYSNPVLREQIDINMRLISEATWEELEDFKKKKLDVGGHVAGCSRGLWRSF